MSDKVLTPAEVARRSISTETDEPYSLRWYEYQIQQGIPLSETGYQNGLLKALEWASIVGDSHEAQRATITRLRGLIEGMGHESQCNAEWTYNADMGCRARRVTPQAEFCNCIQSKVNL